MTHRLASEIHALTAGYRVPTTFFGAPPRWLFGIGSIAGVLAAAGRRLIQRPLTEQQ